MADLRGIDVSHHQPPCDWKKVAASGIVLVYCKATEGLTHEDPLYARHTSGAAEAGLHVGAYHYFHPDRDAVQQAEFFLRVVGTNPARLPHALDLEATDNVAAPLVLERTAKWLEIVGAAIRQPALLYTAPKFWRRLGDSKDFSMHPLWLANYAKRPELPGGWSKYAIWQFSSGGRVDGIASRVDLNAVDPDWFAAVTRRV